MPIIQIKVYLVLLQNLPLRLLVLRPHLHNTRGARSMANYNSFINGSPTAKTPTPAPSASAVTSALRASAVYVLTLSGQLDRAAIVG